MLTRSALVPAVTLALGVLSASPSSAGDPVTCTPPSVFNPRWGTCTIVVEGTRTQAAVPGYTVAGKTGTAAKIDPDGRYSHTRYVASFVGLVPATKPRLVILVMVDEPSGSIYGGDVAAPAFKQIARFNLQHLEVPPDDLREAGSSGR